MTVKNIPLTSDFSASRIEVSLDNELFQFRSYWNKRTQGWYVDIIKLNDDSTRDILQRGARLRPSSTPLLSSARNEIDGEIVCVGSTRYRRNDLGERLRLLYVTSED